MILKTITLLICLGCLSGTATATELAPLETLLPAKTNMLLVIEDVPSFLTAWSESPWGKLLEDPGIQDTWKEMREEHADSGDKTAAYLETLGMISGQAALIVPDLTEFLTEDGKSKGSLALVAEISEEGKTILKNNMDEDVFVAELGETTVIGWPEDFVVGLKKTLGGESGPKLSGTTTFKKMRERSPKTDAYLYIDSSVFSTIFDQGLEAEMKTDPSGGMMGLTPEGIRNALGLDALEGIYICSRQLSSETVMDMGLLFKEARGFTRLMAYLPGPCPRPGFIPEQALTVSVTRFSVTDMWDGILQMLETASPGMSEMLLTQLQQVSMSLGVDVEKDILQNLGDDSFSAYLPRPSKTGDWDEVDQVLGITVRDPAGLQRVVDTALTSFGAELPAALGSEDYKGTTVYSMGETDGSGFSYAITDKYLLVSVGSPQGVKTLLKGMNGGVKSIWDRRDLKPLFAELPSNASMISYTDVSALAKVSMESALKEMKEHKQTDAAGSNQAEVTEWVENFDWKAVGKLFGPMISSSLKTDDGLFSTVRMIHPK